MKFHINNLDEKTKKIVVSIFAGVVIAAAAVSMLLNPGPEHIVDTNGAANFALQQITEADVVACKIGTRGLSTSESQLDLGNISISSGTKYSSGKFTGVYRLHSCTIFKGSDIYVQLADFQVTGGNFAFYVVFDGQIIGEVIPDSSGITEFLIENIEKTGTLEYIIAGESADFCFIAPTEW